LFQDAHFYNVCDANKWEYSESIANSTICCDGEKPRNCRAVSDSQTPERSASTPAI